MKIDDKYVVLVGCIIVAIAAMWAGYSMADSKIRLCGGNITISGPSDRSIIETDSRYCNVEITDATIIMNFTDPPKNETNQIPH